MPFGIAVPPPPNANVGYTAHMRIILNLALSALSIGVVATIRGVFFPARRVSTAPGVEALRHGN
jgi:putative ABC transport system permease protein